jgi:hypothetical protein
MTDPLIEAMGRAIFFTPNSAERSQGELHRMWVEWIGERGKAIEQAQAALSVVKQHLTSAESVERAAISWAGARGWPFIDEAIRESYRHSMKAALLAALEGNEHE